jgi:hypothetical protein
MDPIMGIFVLLALLLWALSLNIKRRKHHHRHHHHKTVTDRLGLAFEQPEAKPRKD